MEVNVAVVTLRQRHKQSPIERIVLDIVAMATDHPDHEQVVRRTVFRRLGVTNRSEEHTSELQSQSNLVCRLLLEKKKNKNKFGSIRSSAATSPLRNIHAWTSSDRITHAACTPRSTRADHSSAVHNKQDTRSEHQS